MTRLETRRGLTLIELLAAAVILSAMAAAAVSIQRDAMEAAERARIEREALAVLETSRTNPGTVNEANEWIRTNNPDAEWRVRTEPIAGDAIESGDGESHISVAWETVIVEQRSIDDGAPVEVLRVRRPSAIETQEVPGS